MTSDRGSLIVFEGCDKVGKTLFCNKLKNLLRNEPVIFLSFPDKTTPTGKLIDKCLSEKDDSNLQWLHLLFAANKFEKLQEILTHLNSGTHVIIDRYIYSGIAYSLASNMDYTWSYILHTGLPIPDMTIMLETDSMFNWNTPKTDLFENEKFQQDVKNCYDSIAKQNWIIINTDNNTFKFIIDSILSHVKREFAKDKDTIKYF